MSDDEIFAAALALPSWKRNAFVGEASDGDAKRCQRILDLIAAHEATDSMLVKSESSSTAIALDNRLGERIGPYKLLEKIGEGGMGSVYLAEQSQPVRRNVALKVVRAGMDSKQVVARFEAERQSLALMDHPNIAKVLDAGETDRGEPYFVMEWVKGIRITEYCDENRLTTKQRAQLMIQVCNAIQHAHQKGIIHRDLKPSNILVAQYDDKAVPKVIDFGVAKATHQRLTEKTLHTQVGQIVGTLEYMSPEQAILNQLDVDTRADVYSLGVVLYELLVGQTPLDGNELRRQGLEQMLRSIREADPPRPSRRLSSQGKAASQTAAYRETDEGSLAKSLRGDLDWVVMKALEKDRKRRYGSPEHFARDIENYLCGQPVEARSPTLAYRASKFAKRNRVALAVVGMLTFVLVFGVGATIWQTTARWRLIAEYLDETKHDVRVLTMQGDLDTAREKLELAKKLGADADWVLLREAHLALQEGDYGDARRAFEVVIRKNPDDIEARALYCACAFYADREGLYYMEVEKLSDSNLVISSGEDFLFRGFAQTWANPNRAVDDIRQAIDKGENHVLARLILARALRLQAADTRDLQKTYHLAKQARNEASIAKTLLPRNSLACAESIHAGIVLANACERLGGEFDSERQSVLRETERVIEESSSFDYSANLHQARFCFYQQFPNTGDDRQELFEQSNVESNSVLTVGKVWHHLRENQVARARNEYESIKGTEHYKFDTLAPAIIGIWDAEQADLQGLQTEFKERLEIEHRDRNGLFAHWDWAVARILQLDEIAIQRGQYGERLIQKVDYEFIHEWAPLIHYMARNNDDPTAHLDELTSNRVLVEHYFLLGIDQLANGNRIKAAEFFQNAIDTDYYQFFAYWWSVAFLEKLENDPDEEWLPWLKKRE